MNWWKIAKLNTYEDRNHINERIVKLETLANAIQKASLLIYQTQRGARRMIANIRDNKTLDVYEDIKNILSLADRLALDRPHEFKYLCFDAVKLLKNKIVELKEERLDFTERRLPNKMKGWQDE